MLCRNIGMGFGRTSSYFQVFETLDGFQSTFSGVPLSMGLFISITFNPFNG